MDTRREFIKKSILLSGAAGLSTLFPPAIQRALAIDPAEGSTFLDAEHIVILMQENRSFDHVFGTLRGVRGYNDPRAIQLPNRNPVWMQTNAKGETYSPFRFDIKDTKITWMGSLPHSRESQVGARNNGRYDHWVEAKKSDDEDFADIPLTMGYYTREDIPFYYAMADAFTVCDQNFCASLTPTDPNRLYFWTGTVRPEPDEDSRAYIDNDLIEKGVDWRTFPELLEENNISWKVYQNEVSAYEGFTGEEDSWLSNFGDNPLEYFARYHVKLLKCYIDFLPEKIAALYAEIEKRQTKLRSLKAGSKEYEKVQQESDNLQDTLNTATADREKYTHEAYENLSDREKNINQKAFVVNSGDPHQHKLTPLNYTDDNISREIHIPMGDVLHQFRQDVQSGNLPTVSWLVAPENFSDHPSAPWFGAWYLSETMDILTQNPEVWKKTIFILTYDENDGYFDHVPPFTAPKHGDPGTGKVSDGIDTRLDHVKLEEDFPGSIGLGFRVPLIIASPWSRGGYVNSQVFDHTSTLQFLEVFLNKKSKKNIEESNITQWRRTVCGDLTSTFRPYRGGKINELSFIKKDPFIETIGNAQFKNVPSNYKNLSAGEIAAFNINPYHSPYMPQQEKGIRPSCALPYELYADGNRNTDNNTFEISLQAKRDYFKQQSAGSPFIIYERNYRQSDFAERNYAVMAGDLLKDSWAIPDFDNNQYHLQVYGPNGFFRVFKGNDKDPALQVWATYPMGSDGQLTGNLELNAVNNGKENYLLEVTDNAYKNKDLFKTIRADAKEEKLVLDLSKSYGWYDFTIKIKGNNTCEKRYAGHVETGKESKSDPTMG